MTLNERLKHAIAESGIKQNALAKIIDISTASMSQFCSGQKNPSPRTVRDICAALNIREEWLRNGTGPMTQTTPESIVSELAKKFHLGEKATALLAAVADAFEGLSEKEAEDIMRRFHAALDAQLNGTQEEEVEALLNVIQLRRYDSPAAAGAPSYADDGYTLIDYPAEEVPDGADFAVGISGQSMEPTVPDGCTVFVDRDARPEDGDIVIAWVAGDGAVCKRILIDCDTIIALESINPDYPNITGEALVGLRVYGVVVGQSAK